VEVEGDGMKDMAGNKIRLGRREKIWREKRFAKRFGMAGAVPAILWM
jgi:hypothetical protein